MSTATKVLAGAGMAAGAVLLCAACMPPEATFSKTFESIGNWLQGLFSGNFKLGEFLSTGAGKATAGAMLLGGGYALHRSHHEDNMVNIDGTEAGMMPDNGYATQIAIDRATMRGRQAVMSQMGQAGVGIG